MLAYLADQGRSGRRPSAQTLLYVVAGHAALLAAALTANGQIPIIEDFTPTVVTLIESPKPPPPPPPPPPRDPSPPNPASQSLIDTPPRIIPTIAESPPLDRGPPIIDVMPIAGNAVMPALPLDPPRPAMMKKAPRFITPADEVRPPYPESKRRLEEEASLRLSLAIDERGRVVAVDALGTADPAFLTAARRHILRHWRYQPATEGGNPIAAHLIVTLRFELET